jgi:hypothetical protein
MQMIDDIISLLSSLIPFNPFCHHNIQLFSYRYSLLNVDRILSIISIGLTFSLALLIYLKQKSAQKDIDQLTRETRIIAEKIEKITDRTLRIIQYTAEIYCSNFIVFCHLIGSPLAMIIMGIRGIIDEILQYQYGILDADQPLNMWLSL